MKFKYLVPLLIFVGLAAALWIGLSLKPSEVPSGRVGRPAPEFTLPPLDGDTRGFGTADLAAGKVSVVNVFASWCAPCRVEHPQMMALAGREDVQMFAIAYKDKPEASRAFLDRLGNPFDAIGADLNGRVAIEWGVYGVPETFILDGEGKVVHRHVGAVMEHDLNEVILPLIQRLGG